MQRLLPLLLFLCIACNDINCPLDNIVEMGCSFHAAETGEAMVLDDTLTVRPMGKDTILLNRAQHIQQCYLPLRQDVPVDTLLLRWSNSKGQAAVDTLYFYHTRQPHFESIDCPPAVFHTLTAVRHSSHALGLMPLTIDSVAIIHTLVNYDNKENLRIYLRSTANR